MPVTNQEARWLNRYMELVDQARAFLHRVDDMEAEAIANAHLADITTTKLKEASSDGSKPFEHLDQAILGKGATAMLAIRDLIKTNMTKLAKLIP